MTEVAGVVYDTFADKATLLLYINLLALLCIRGERNCFYLFSTYTPIEHRIHALMHYILPKAYQTKGVNVNQHQIIGKPFEKFLSTY